MKGLLSARNDGTLALKGLEFILTQSDGTKTVIFTAANEEIAQTICRMLDAVHGAGNRIGMRIGYRNGLKNGLLIGGAVMAMALIGYSAIQIALWRKAHIEEEEDDAE